MMKKVNQRYTMVLSAVSLIALQKPGHKIRKHDMLIQDELGGRVFSKDEFVEILNHLLAKHGYTVSSQVSIRVFYWWRKQGAIFPVSL